MGLKGFDGMDVSKATVKRIVIPDLDSVSRYVTWATTPAPAVTGPPDVHRLVIPGFRPVLKNELMKRGNHHRAARLKRADRHAVIVHAVAAGIPPAAGKRRVSIEVTLAGRMRVADPDAFWPSLLDALVQARLLVDDCPDYVELGPVTQVKGDAKATKIILEEIF